MDQNKGRKPCNCQGTGNHNQESRSIHELIQDPAIDPALDGTPNGVDDVPMELATTTRSRTTGEEAADDRMGSDEQRKRMHA
eukprot:2945854-Amphidinium_carterae.2